MCPWHISQKNLTNEKKIYYGRSTGQNASKVYELGKLNSRQEKSTMVEV